MEVNKDRHIMTKQEPGRAARDVVGDCHSSPGSCGSGPPTHNQTEPYA